MFLKITLLRVYAAPCDTEISGEKHQLLIKHYLTIYLTITVHEKGQRTINSLNTYLIMFTIELV